jgi:predicted TIM-barrel fold metal-dependent hydrolase
MITAAKALENFDLLELDEETKSRFLGGNAARVFGIDD